MEHIWWEKRGKFTTSIKRVLRNRRWRWSIWVWSLTHFNSSEAVNRYVLKVRLIAVLEHCVTKNRHILFTLTKEAWPGTNHVMKAAHHFIETNYRRHKLPKTLYVLVENYLRETKNGYSFGCLQHLIIWSDSNEIYASFLLIGPIHKAKDQNVLCTARHLKESNAVTLSELYRKLGETYRDLTTSTNIASVAYVSRLFEKS